jgi:curved DNA-binding protein CbpA
MYTLPDNPYVALGVPKNAQIPEIRSAHRKLVLKCHPDKVTDPAQKAIKQEEFQRVQKAYELLSDEKERQNYDDMVIANELSRENDERRRRDRDRDREFTPGRTPPRQEHDYRSSPHYNVNVRGDPGFNVRTAEPPSFKKSSSFPSSKSPYASTRTPPRSYEDDIHFSSGFDEVPRESRKARKGSVVYEKEPSRHEEEKRRRRDDEWDRANEKAKRKEQERKELEKRELERKDKERRKEEKKRVEKAREQERKRESDEKRSRHKSPYVEELDPETIIYNASPPKADKKAKSSSSRKHEVPVREPSRTPVASERERKQHDNLEFAAQYLETSRSKAPPGMPRSKTYHSSTFNVRHLTPPPAAVPTPPPAAHNVAAPPPPPVYLDEESRRLSGRSTARRMSHDSPRVKVPSSTSHKKSSGLRDAHIDADPIRPPTFKKSSTMPTSHGTPPSVPESPPRIHRAQTGGDYSRPPPGMPSITRSQTWMPGDDGGERSRSRHAREFTDEDSEDDRRPRRSRRARSPDDVPPMPRQLHYTVDKSTGRALPVRSSTYHDESASGRKSKPSYYMPEANVGRPMEHRPAMPSHQSYGSAQYFEKVKTAKTFDPEEIAFSQVPHTQYRGDPVYTY